MNRTIRHLIVAIAIALACFAATYSAAISHRAGGTIVGPALVAQVATSPDTTTNPGGGPNGI